MLRISLQLKIFIIYEINKYLGLFILRKINELKKMLYLGAHTQGAVFLHWYWYTLYFYFAGKYYGSNEIIQSKDSLMNLQQNIAYKQNK